MANTHASTTPRNKRPGFTLDDIENMKVVIDAMPRKPRLFTPAEALIEIAPNLKKRKDDGDSLADLVQYCTERELHVSERQISRAIRTISASKIRKKKVAANAA